MMPAVIFYVLLLNANKKTVDTGTSYRQEITRIAELCVCPILAVFEVISPRGSRFFSLAYVSKNSYVFCGARSASIVQARSPDGDRAFFVSAPKMKTDDKATDDPPDHPRFRTS